VTLEALEPFRCEWTRAASDPQPLAYLDSADNRERGGLDVQLEVCIETSLARAERKGETRLSRGNFRHAYWTAFQMLAHHTSNGCNLQPGDLLGTGTQSGPDPKDVGSMLELTAGGKSPVTLLTGEMRSFIEDGDTVIMRAWCERPGYPRIGFGACAGTVVPAA
jgi:fumarylacetoacetase